jgi:cell division protein FtsB
VRPSDKKRSSVRKKDTRQSARPTIKENKQEKKPSKIIDFKRARLKRVADKQFSKHQANSNFNSSSNARSNTDATPSKQASESRPALYKAQMGRSHKKSLRTQRNSSSQKKGAKTSASLKSRFLTSKIMGRSAIVACALFACVLLYPSAQSYYVGLRDYEKLQAEYVAALQHNDSLRSEINTLSTEEGVESLARDEFGWVKNGENAVLVYGLEGENQELSSIENIDTGVTESPKSWTTGVLDYLFAYE